MDDDQVSAALGQQLAQESAQRFPFYMRGLQIFGLREARHFISQKPGE